MMTGHRKIVLTGGPGGGKTTLIRALMAHPDWKGRLTVLPEAIFLMRDTGVDPAEKQFQRVMVHLQMSLEDGLERGLGAAKLKAILCHRGSLDPLAYWLDRGWTEAEFFTFSETKLQEHLQRYHGVVHLVTAAEGAADRYVRWPQAHRPESVEDAVRLDRLLGQVWSRHPGYHRIDNQGKDWPAKADEAIRLLTALTA